MLETFANALHNELIGTAAQENVNKNSAIKYFSNSIQVVLQPSFRKSSSADKLQRTAFRELRPLENSPKLSLKLADWQRD